MVTSILPRLQANLSLFERLPVKHFEGSTYVFVVRIWHEPREEGFTSLVWRGMVEDLATKERLYFDNLVRLLNYLRERASIDSDEIEEE